MSQASYRDIGGPDGHLANLRPFRGHTMRAEWDGERFYEVFSYSTMIAVHDRLANTRAIQPRQYSRTTSRHQGLCRAWLPGTDEL